MVDIYPMFFCHHEQTCWRLKNSKEYMLSNRWIQCDVMLNVVLTMWSLMNDVSTWYNQDQPYMLSLLLPWRVRSAPELHAMCCTCTITLLAYQNVCVKCMSHFHHIYTRNRPQASHPGHGVHICSSLFLLWIYTLECLYVTDRSDPYKRWKKHVIAYLRASTQTVCWNV